MDNGIIAENATTDDVSAAPTVENEVHESDSPEVVEKSFTQAELDAIVAKRLGKEHRKWQREVQEAEQNKAITREVKVENFETHEEYVDALAEQKADKLLADREARKEQKAISETYAEKEENAREKYADFAEVVHNPKLSITQTMADAIRSSDNGPEIAYFLGNNPNESKRISQLPPLNQAREIGKLENKLTVAPVTVKKVSNAPAPISPVTSRSGKDASYDTTDPRSTKSMTTSEWIEAERKRQIKKLKG